ncbi:hypothetical protein V8F20_006822 [Naviculisporaceae sp. PSN 640]
MWPTEPSRRATDRFRAPATTCPTTGYVTADSGGQQQPQHRPDGVVASLPGVGQIFLSASRVQNIINQSERLRAAVNQWRSYAFTLEDQIKDLGHPRRTGSTTTKPASAVRMPTTPHTPTTTEPARLTCRKCQSVLPSRNQLFKHIFANACRPRQPSQRPPASSAAPATVLLPVRQPTGPSKKGGFPKSVMTASIKPVTSTTVTTPSVKPAVGLTSSYNNSLSLPDSPAQPASLPTARPPSLESPVQQACQQCGLSFPSRNRLFAHLNSEQHARPAKTHGKRSWDGKESAWDARRCHGMRDNVMGCAETLWDGMFGKWEALFRRVVKTVMTDMCISGPLGQPTGG